MRTQEKRTRSRTKLLRAQERGVSLIELLIAVMLVTISLVAVTGTIYKCTMLQTAIQEQVMARNECRDVLEQLRRGDPADQFTPFNNNPNFAVDGLEAATGTVEFPQDLLVQTMGPPTTGMVFRDLDLDGFVDLDPAATESFSLLPARVTVQWGGSEMSFVTLLTNK